MSKKEIIYFLWSALSALIVGLVPYVEKGLNLSTLGIVLLVALTLAAGLGALKALGDEPPRKE